MGSRRFEALWHSRSPCRSPSSSSRTSAVWRSARSFQVEVWRDALTPPPHSSTPVYREEYGLWEPAEAFVKLAFDASGPHGARFFSRRYGGLRQDPATGDGGDADGALRHPARADPGAEDAALAVAGRDAAAAGPAFGGLDRQTMGRR